ncbi:MULTISPECIES: EAL domain-containing protein [Shewanella]|uniref:EAL domain-containing protein n=1 Tax=Shewanella marisflavi TaxID=260364 RepID=A0ABX5WQ47_9GAMM|nr:MULTISPECIES: EAL domain-containing protein [Shewanella]QDF76691.1 EAL domain-containing protein [Shewanella marisflavi]
MSYSQALRLIGLCLLLFCVSGPSVGGDLVQRVFGARDGLNNATVNDISFDEYGYTWLSTEQGLYRISDTKARRIDKDANLIRLSDEYIYLTESLSKKHLLVSSYANTYLYDIINDKFVQLGSPQLFPEFHRGGLQAITRQKDGSYVLLSYHGELYRLNYEAMSLSFISALPTDPDMPWFVLSQFGDSQLIVGKSYELQLRDSLGMLRGLFPWTEEQGQIKSLFEDRAGRLWLGSSNGLYRVYPDTLTLEKVEQLPFYVTQMAQDKLGFLWLSGREGLIKWHPDTLELKRFTDDLKLAADLDYIYDLAVDSNDLVWVGGSGDGLAIIADNPDFVIDDFTQRAPYRLSDEMVWTIYADEQQLWLGTDKGLIEIDRVAKTSQTFVPDELEVNDSVYMVSPFDEQYLLLGTTNGLFVYDRLSQKTLRFAEISGGRTSLENKMIYSTYKDPLITSRWWFVTATGLFYWDKGSLEPSRMPVKGVDGTQHQIPLRSIYRGADGKLWVGGENLFGYIDNKGLFYSRIDIFADNNISIDVSYIKEVDSGVLWLGTSPKGLVEYHPKTGLTYFLTDNWQVDCSSIYFIEQLPGYRVLGCANSLIRQDLTTGGLTVIEKQDGLISHELNDGAAYYEPSAGLFVGSPDGVSLVDVSLMRNRLAEDGIMMESVSVFYEDSTEIKLVPDPGMLIKPGARLISFQLTSLDYLTDIPFQLQYRLRHGQNSEESKYLQLMGQSQVNVSGLKEGRYTLDILSEQNGVWSQTPYSFSFVVEDYWWNYDWFRALVIISLLLVGLYFLLLRQKQLSAFRRVNRALKDSEDRLRQSLRGSDSELWEWHSDSDSFLLENRGRYFPEKGDAFELKMEEFPIYADDQDKVFSAWKRLLSKQDDRLDVDYRYRRPDDSWGWTRVRGRALEFDAVSGKVRKVAGIYTDITTQRRLEDDVKLLAQAFANTSEGVLILDADERVRVSNKAAQKILGMTADELIDRYFAQLVHSSEERSDEINILLEQGITWTGEHEFQCAEGLICPVWLNLSTMTDERGAISHYVAVFSDITERKQTEADLRRLANYDVLTGLPNRSLFASRLAKCIHRAEQTQEKLALIFLDLDRFKNVNDSYGHSMGDALLVEAASRLQSCVSDNHTLCRFGGDEFVILMRDMADIDEVNHLCEALIRQIEQPFELYGREFFISTSIGVSLWPDDAKQPEVLIKNADQAMYHAKDEGRGNFQYFSAERNAEALYHLKLEAELRKAIDRQEFELHFQPQIDILKDDKVVGMEALLRWHHPTEGYIRPDIFIRVAESCGLIIDIDRWVIKQACIQGAKWGEEFGEELKLSVNVSAVHFRQPDFIQDVQQALQESGMPAKMLGLEITEGVLMKELHVAKDHLEALRAIGIDVAIDDFGTGYSSLAYLRSFDVSTLKIDRSFLIDIANNEADQAIASSIIELARNLKLKVVAEGVETQEQLEQVFSRGCYIIQGYYFAKPMATTEFEQYLNAQLQ